MDRPGHGVSAFKHIGTPRPGFAERRVKSGREVESLVLQSPEDQHEREHERKTAFTRPVRLGNE
jgi:hypothetical protein